ncbi:MULTISPECIES: hypothetical protein [unclassified Sulfuricurvum]|uniref:hypothetical protein n=1 Tax=unclassified Sulfuricurvum TaxID=2632390 RepID=UPI000299649A|nr:MULTISPECIES: hypothetical protein [unclassified Sulfuricurvum]AFV97900.1 hypothetical protein B649_07940 [Candidatus Sulfuricurvum sp. RIFRC-1]HBM35555.1 hypothetical protein [Sulfuricurvum sp.]
MKVLLSVLSATALLSTFVFAEPAMMQNQKGQMNHGMMHGKEKMMNAPEKVSQEMGKQEKGMGYGQGQGMMQGNAPEKVSQEMGKQEKGMGYGQGQGMMQGKQKGMDESGGMMGSGKSKGKGMMQGMQQDQNSTMGSGMGKGKGRY